MSGMTPALIIKKISREHKADAGHLRGVPLEEVPFFPFIFDIAARGALLFILRPLGKIVLRPQVERALWEVPHTGNPLGGGYDA
jgi:hypothetical protein